MATFACIKAIKILHKFQAKIVMHFLLLFSGQYLCFVIVISFNRERREAFPHYANGHSTLREPDKEFEGAWERQDRTAAT